MSFWSFLLIWVLIGEVVVHYTWLVTRYESHITSSWRPDDSPFDCGSVTPLSLIIGAFLGMTWPMVLAFGLVMSLIVLCNSKSAIGKPIRAFFNADLMPLCFKRKSNDTDAKP